MEELNLNIKTDYETMRDLIMKLNQSALEKSERITILKDLEFHVHQVVFIFQAF